MYNILTFDISYEELDHIISFWIKAVPRPFEDKDLLNNAKFNSMEIQFTCFLRRVELPKYHKMF